MSDADILCPPPPVKTVEANLQRGNEAMDRVLTLHVDVLNAMQRPEVTEGPISFYWGNKGGGVLHILEGHGEEAVRMMPAIIAKGEVQAPFTTPRGRQRRNIVHGDWVASLSLERFGKHEVWLVTGFSRNAPVASADPHMNRAELRSPGLSSLPEEGAGAAGNMAPAPPGSNPPGTPPGTPHGTKLTSGIDPADVWRHLGKPALDGAKCAVSAILAQCHNARPSWVILTVTPSPAPTATA